MSLELFGRILSRQRRQLGAYKTLWEIPEGRTVLTDLLVQSGLLSTSQVPGDSHATAFAEGRRSLGLHIVKNLRWTEGELVQLAMQRTAEQLAEAQEQEA